ncbi:hypothetical protein BpHYR1_038917 [Brachionus plicatilis]|uniref:Uncharacterized protein n=1 Tax=Brachionus plicatilis TaxID=10195 RepID=A0A3M7S014_BRAPC|nr:hypothetical protein BpHYR1_038917 [Brachionus plicatilis]
MFPQTFQHFLPKELNKEILSFFLDESLTLSSLNTTYIKIKFILVPHLRSFKKEAKISINLGIGNRN